MRTWFYQKFNIPIGIAIISCWFGISTLLGLIYTVNSIETLKSQSSFGHVLAIGTILTSIGLIFKKRWSWNFIVFFNSYILILGLFDVLEHYFYTECAGNLKRLVLAVLFNLAIHGPIYYYLFQKEIKNLYPKSPISLFIIGFYLTSFTRINQIGSLPFFITGVRLGNCMKKICKKC